MSKVDPISHDDWTYTRVLRERDAAGGLVLQDVRHQQYLLAKDMRVTRLWAGSLIAGKPILKDFQLGSAALPLSITTGPIPLPTEQGLIAPYHVPFKESANFEMTDPVLGLDTGSQPLSVQQDYLFTDYGKDPPHEPAGVIDAVRIYPLLSFRYPASTAGARLLDYIRVDYRLALTVEQFVGDATNVRKGTEFQDQIGVFRDGEVLKFPYGIDEVFDAGEKPVKWELLGEGLDWGTKSQWDNIHQWAVGKTLPETPGASHAAHIHWRWGTPATEKTDYFPPKPKAGPQFAGVGGVAGAPQIDPRIPQQRLLFAITSFTPTPGAGPKAWSADENGSTAHFEELFIKARGSAPLDISSGTGLVVWISIEARRKPSRDPWQGTFFAHGIFFAHEVVSLGRLARNVGKVESPLSKGTVNSQIWWRPKRPENLP